MILKHSLFPNFIREITIEDDKLIIINVYGSKKEIQISEIRKIYINNSNKNHYLIYTTIILAVLFSFYYAETLKIKIVLTIFFFTIFLIMKEFITFKTKFLLIKFNDKSIYTNRFKSNNKEEILKIIWKIKDVNIL